MSRPQKAVRHQKCSKDVYNGTVPCLSRKVGRRWCPNFKSTGQSAGSGEQSALPFMSLHPPPDIKPLAATVAPYRPFQQEKLDSIPLFQTGWTHYKGTTSRALGSRFGTHVPPMVASRVLLTHSETVFLQALAAASIRFASSIRNRTRTVRTLASSLGSRGRPGFLGFGFDVDISS
jgi:hypothetical protein